MKLLILIPLLLVPLGALHAGTEVISIQPDPASPGRMGAASGEPSRVVNPSGKVAEPARADDRLLPAVFVDPPVHARPGAFWDWLNGSKAERLLPSQSGERNRLPAVPQAGVEGNVSGPRARDRLAVDMTCRDGKLTKTVVRSQAGQPGHLRWQDRICEVKIAVREIFSWTGE